MARSGEDKATDWLQIGLATLALNAASGLAFGSFGTLILSIEQEYGAGRAVSSLALSLLIVSLSATASLLGRVLERVSIRKTMVAGALTGALGFAAASIAANATQLLAAYLFLLGPATAMLGIVPATTLAQRWASEQRRGLALGIVNMPLLVMVVPLVIAPLLHAEGVRTVYRSLAMVDLMLVPLLIMVRDKAPEPKAIEEVCLSAERQVTALDLLCRPSFWLLVVAQGLLVGAGTMKLAHFVPLLIEQGRTFDEANFLLAISGGAGLVGSFAFGLLAGRMGGAKALICNALVQAGMWTIFLAPVNFGVLLADAIVVGACGAGVQAAFCVAISRLSGETAFSLALGLVSLLTLPFLFGLTPLASLLYQHAGNYHLPMGMMIGGFILAAALLTSPMREEAGPRIQTKTREKP